MATVVVTGGGLIGLSTAMLLAKDGHEVTVLERDPNPPPATPTDAWERVGAARRQPVPHAALLPAPRSARMATAELPEVVAGLRRRRRAAVQPVGRRPGRDHRRAPAGRRARSRRSRPAGPVAESVVASVAAATPGVTVRRGVGGRAACSPGPSRRPGVPHVIGVVTETGEEIRADLVVDATGRRSPLPRGWPTPARRHRSRRSTTCGFVYYGRHFRSADGSMPPAFGPLLQHYESLSILTLPADNGTWGVGLDHERQGQRAAHA